MNRREQDRRAADWAYKSKFSWYKNCVYCGDLATCLDHVFPLSIAAQLSLDRPSVRAEIGSGLYKVPCCRECNGMASNKPFKTILDKRSFLKRAIAKKHKRVFQMPVWDMDEIEGLGKNMRSSVISGLNKRYLVELRLSHPCRDTWVDPNIFTRVDW